MRLFFFRLAGILVPLLVLSQIVVPGFVGGRLEDRITERGGSADVSLSAFPALRLLAGGGDKLYVRASGLRLEARGERPFDELDKFGDATVSISDSEAGPFRVQSFFLDRTGDQRYRVFATVRTNLADLGRYAGERLGGSFGGALAGLAASALATGGEQIPAQLRATVDTSGERPRTLDGQADVGGLPAGPVALLLVDVLLAGL